MSGAAEATVHETERQPTLILGLGNPILRDDRAGLEVAQALFERLPRGSVELCSASVGGLELLHLLEGHSRVLIVDALRPGVLRPGEVRELALTDIEGSAPPLTPHHAGLAHCLRLGRLCGLQMPEEMMVFAIGVQDPYTFDERCTDEVRRAIPGIVRLIERRVFGPEGCWALPHEKRA